jgi:hypothetical protein
MAVLAYQNTMEYADTYHSAHNLQIICFIIAGRQSSTGHGGGS